jgi:hypothetical protein
MKILTSIMAGCLMTASTLTFAASSTYGGVTFPEGDISFADKVISFTPGSDVGAGWNDPTKALGAPDYPAAGGSAVSLGDGGALIVQFTDNYLTTSGDDAKDLWIFEVGGAVESFNVSISSDLSSWIDLGYLSGQPTGIDIDSILGVSFGDTFSYVRLIDDISIDQTNSPFGEADIDAIGAISTIASPVPEVSTWLMFSVGLGLVALRRKSFSNV